MTGTKIKKRSLKSWLDEWVLPSKDYKTLPPGDLHFAMECWDSYAKGDWVDLELRMRLKTAEMIERQNLREQAGYSPEVSEIKRLLESEVA